MCTRSSSARVARRGSRRRRASRGAPGIETVEHGPDACGPLGVAPAGVVFLEVGIGRDQEHAPRLTNTPHLTSPLTVPVATLAAGEGAPGAVVPISWWRRPRRGVARPDRRRIPGVARSRRALAPNDATDSSNDSNKTDTARS